MPLLDNDSNEVGCVQVESREHGNYCRNYMLIDFSTHKLRLYPEEAEFSTDLTAYDIQTEINCQYIMKVNAAATRPKVLNCLEVETTTGSYILSVDSKEERDEWIESIRKASMRQASHRASVRGERLTAGERPTGYETKVVGGVVQKTPIATGNGERFSSSTEGVASKQDGKDIVRHRGFPRILKAGHGIKLGAVMKNWKRRFFVLTEISLSYYKSIEELEPIKSVSVGEVTSVSSGSKEFPGKEHLFEVTTPIRTFYVQVDSNQDLQDWVKVFNTLLQSIKPTLQQHGRVGGATDASTGEGTEEHFTAV